MCIGVRTGTAHHGDGLIPLPFYKKKEKYFGNENVRTNLWHADAKRRHAPRPCFETNLGRCLCRALLCHTHARLEGDRYCGLAVFI